MVSRELESSYRHIGVEIMAVLIRIDGKISRPNNCYRQELKK